MNTKTIIFFIISTLIFSCHQPVKDKLLEGFRNPPPAYRPWVYWYWIDENISREGITKDLEAMARVGIGKALIGHISPGNQRGNVRILSEAWWGMVEHAVREGQRLGVDIGFFNGPGWSQSGGPWINKDQAMRYVVSHEIQLNGPSVFQGNLSISDTLFESIALQAFPDPDVHLDPCLPEFEIIRSDPDMSEVKNLFDGKEDTHFKFPDALFADSSLLSIDLRFRHPVAVQTITFDFLPISMLVNITLKFRDENGKFHTIRHFELDRRNINFEIGPMRFDPATFTLPVSRSNEYRIIFSDLTGTPGTGLKEVKLGTGARVDQSIEKQLGKMYSDPLPEWNAYLWETQAEPEIEDLIDPEQIIDLSRNVDESGNLTWEVPAGNWILLQTGMIPTGATNVPAPPEATGYECDKFTEEAVEKHFEAFIGKFLKSVPAQERRSFKTVVIDSYEVGPQNWTGAYRDIFQARYGYDPIPWLPVFSGRIIESADLSNRFLWDVRRLTADLISNVYVRRLRELSNENGLDLWLENYGHWGFPGEFLQYGGQADLVSGEFWFENALWNLGPLECRAASSSAHIYGKNQVFAEAFTAGFNFLQYPAIMKSRGDQMLCEGINHFVQHVSIHQPWDDRVPGVTAWFGMSYQRHNTWFEQSKAWNEYLKRCHYLLQQGLPVSDVCYFIGEDAPKMTGILDPALPYGFDYDFINADVILNRLTIRDGLLVLPDGKSYHLLVLPPLETMRPDVLKKIRVLIQNGANVYGLPPSHSPSMENYPEADNEIQEIARELWGNRPESSGNEYQIGTGRLFCRTPMDQVLDKLGIDPDILCKDTTITYTHRKTGDWDIYFLSNPDSITKIVEISFRISGKLPEFWHPDTGHTEKVALFEFSEKRTKVPVNLDPFGSVFLVFREPSPTNHFQSVRIDVPGEMPDQAADKKPIVYYGDNGSIDFRADKNGNYTFESSEGLEYSCMVNEVPEPLALNGPWQIHFPENQDTPSDTVFQRLMSWTDHKHVGIRYFSGTVSYLNTVDIPVEWTEHDQQVFLDLGEVRMMAEVILNGKNLGVLWKNPFRLEITSEVIPGQNNLEVRVTNTWWNRLVGDEKYPLGFPGSKADHPRTFTTTKAWNAGSELLPSGLLGPVKMELVKIINIEDRK